MAEQLACFLSPIVGDSTTGFSPQISTEGVSTSGAMNRLPDGTPIPFAKDFEVMGQNDITVAAGLTLAYVIADETAISTLESNPDYHLFWMTYTDPLQSDTLAEPTALNVNGDLTSLRDYIAAHTGKTNDQILQWFGNRFDVTKEQAVAKATSENRMWLVQKMMVAMRHWSEAQAEFDALQ